MEKEVADHRIILKSFKQFMNLKLKILRLYKRFSLIYELSILI